RRRGEEPLVEQPSEALLLGRRSGDHQREPPLDCSEVPLSGLRQQFLDGHAILDGDGDPRVAERLEKFVERELQLHGCGDRPPTRTKSSRSLRMAGKPGKSPSFDCPSFSFEMPIAASTRVHATSSSVAGFFPRPCTARTSSKRRTTAGMKPSPIFRPVVW